MKNRGMVCVLCFKGFCQTIVEKLQNLVPRAFGVRHVEQTGLSESHREKGSVTGGVPLHR